MKSYLDLLKHVYDHGIDHEDRTGVGRRSIFGTQVRFDMSDGTLPLLTSRKMFPKSIIHELIWFISGAIDVKYLKDNGVNIWDLWTLTKDSIRKYFQDKLDEGDEALLEFMNTNYDGNFEEMVEAIHNASPHVNTTGPMYGAAWRYAPGQPAHIPNISIIPSDKRKVFDQAWLEEHQEQGTNPGPMDESDQEYIGALKEMFASHYDQLAFLVYNLKHRPFSSRHVVNAWITNYMPSEDLSIEENLMIGRGALTACHYNFQCFVTPGVNDIHTLSLKFNVRSQDLCIGAPSNIAQYAILLAMLAEVLGYERGELIWDVGDAHIYLNHLEQVEEHLNRPTHPLPLLDIEHRDDITEFTFDDIKISQYVYEERIDYALAK